MKKAGENLVRRIRKSTSLRISVFNTVVFCVAFLLVLLIDGWLNYRSVEKNENKRSHSFLSVSELAIDNKLKDMERITLMAIAGDETQNILQKYETAGVRERNALEKNVAGYFTSLSMLRDDVKGIYLFDNNSMVYYYDAANPSRVRSKNELETLGHVMQEGSMMPGAKCTLATTQLPSFFRYSGRYTQNALDNTVVWLIRDVNSFSPYVKIGTIVLSVPSRVFQTLLSDIIGDEYIFILCSEDGKIISCSDEMLIGTSLENISQDLTTMLAADEKKVVWENKKCLMFQQVSEYSGLHILVGKPVSSMMQPLVRQLCISIPILILAMCLVVFMTFYHVRRLLKPLNTLSVGMQHFDEKSLDIRYEVASKDEIGQLIGSFNRMIDMMQQLIDEKYVNEMKIQKAQLTEQRLSMLYLKSQINPHFLYNTIDAIRIQAKINDDEIVEELLLRLVKFFRLSIKADSQMVTMEHEMDMICAYLELMQFHYPKLECFYDVDSDLMDVSVPNFILQPLVENSLQHGLRNKGYEGSITIYAGRVPERNGYMEIRIEDTGVGFGESRKEKMEHLLHDTSEEEISEQSRESIGIVNVQRRIKMLSGEECGLWYSENEKEGLTAHILLRM